jgi:hypothetical protein
MYSCVPDSTQVNFYILEFLVNLFFIVILRTVIASFLFIKAFFKELDENDNLEVIKKVARTGNLDHPFVALSFALYPALYNRCWRERQNPHPRPDLFRMISFDVPFTYPAGGIQSNRLRLFVRSRFGCTHDPDQHVLHSSRLQSRRSRSSTYSTTVRQGHSDGVVAQLCPTRWLRLRRNITHPERTQCDNKRIVARD